jgi:hypothetical protein
MPTTTSAVVQLLTRIPYSVRHRAKVNRGVHYTTLTPSMIGALRERLETTQRARPRVAAR